MFIGGFKVDYFLILLPPAAASCQLPPAAASCQLIYTIILPGKLLASLQKIKKSTKTDFVYS